MDATHRQILQKNRSNLVRELDPSSLYDGLLSRGIFTQDMIDEIQSAGTRRDQARQLVRDLETRGSRAFAAFLEGLQETGQDHVAQLLLDGDSPRPPVPTLERPTLLPNYKMDASPCGHCLIINNVDFESQSELKDRKGSDIDCDRLERRFKSLNFIMDHSKYDCCVVIILSHGTEATHSRFPGAVHGVDGPSVPVQNITSYLNGQHCPSLQGKPKLFFIQACGGGKRGRWRAMRIITGLTPIFSHGDTEPLVALPMQSSRYSQSWHANPLLHLRPASSVSEKDTGFEVSPDEFKPSAGGGVDDETDALPVSSSSDSLSLSDEPDARATLPTPSDILVSYSTFPGYVSWRDTQTGSWYVETLDRIMEENVATSDLVTILMMVSALDPGLRARAPRPHACSPMVKVHDWDPCGWWLKPQSSHSKNTIAVGPLSKALNPTLLPGGTGPWLACLYKQMPGSFNFLRKLLYFQPPHGQGQTPPQ
ncbi:hypothetical protein JZ751_023974 [Albula glossodonta]|uniref:Caspase 9 n=1 Tax=Albula glossodonta TaxID=121402 RepID=A0A8T2NH02_9TELE|nr:hypothetical protein JZ751_023974 [Albula glossodonta]